MWMKFEWKLAAMICWSFLYFFEEGGVGRGKINILGRELYLDDCTQNVFKTGLRSDAYELIFFPNVW